MNNEKHNGWTNYETWAVNLWLSNDQASQEYWRAQAGRGRHAHDLADQLKEGVTEQAPDIGCSLYSDLLQAALDEVNWKEVAKGMLELEDVCEPVYDYIAPARRRVPVEYMELKEGDRYRLRRSPGSKEWVRGNIESEKEPGKVVYISQ